MGLDVQFKLSMWVLGSTKVVLFPSLISCTSGVWAEMTILTVENL